MCTEENVNVANEDVYNSIKVMTYDHNNESINSIVKCGAMGNIADTITAELNSLVDYPKLNIHEFIFVLETNTEGEVEEGIGIMVFRIVKADNIKKTYILYVNDDICDYSGYIHAIREGIRNVRGNLTFIDDEKNKMKILGEDYFDLYDGYHYLHIEKVYDKGGSYVDSIENGVNDLYTNLKPLIIEFLDKDELVKLTITFDVNESGKDIDELYGTVYINIRKNIHKHILEVYLSDGFKSYHDKYYPKLKKALDNIGFEYRFKDEEEYLANKIKEVTNKAKKGLNIDNTGCEVSNEPSTTACCAVNNSKYDDAHNINGNNPFTSIIGDVEVLEDDNIKDNLTRIELLDDIKALIDGSKNSSNLLHYDAEIVTKIKEVLIACYERVEK